MVTPKLYVLDDWTQKDSRRRDWSAMIGVYDPTIWDRKRASIVVDVNSDSKVTEGIVIIHRRVLRADVIKRDGKSELDVLSDYVRGQPGLICIVVSGGGQSDAGVTIPSQLYVRNAPVGYRIDAVFRETLERFIVEMKFDRVDFSLLEPAALSDDVYSAAHALLIHFLPNFLSENKRIDGCDSGHESKFHPDRESAKPQENSPAALYFNPVTEQLDGKFPELSGTADDAPWHRLSDTLASRLGREAAETKIADLGKVVADHDIAQGRWYENLRSQLTALTLEERTDTIKEECRSWFHDFKNAMDTLTSSLAKLAPGISGAARMEAFNDLKWHARNDTVKNCLEEFFRLCDSAALSVSEIDKQRMASIRITLCNIERVWEEAKAVLLSDYSNARADQARDGLTRLSEASIEIDNAMLELIGGPRNDQNELVA